MHSLHNEENEYEGKVFRDVTSVTEIPTNKITVCVVTI
jgi:hypothetical protein